MSAASREHFVHLLRQMLRIRRLEEKSAELYTQGKISGFLHLYVGEEAVAVGAIEALADDDAIVATYREHGHGLLRGLAMAAILGEMLGKSTGCSRGRGGSMHFFCTERCFYGGHAIVGAGLPVAVGIALADKLQARRRVTACFFGDGAADEGAFHESLNLAALWRLPVLFLCENNQYSMGTALARHQSNVEIWQKPPTYGIPSEKVDRALPDGQRVRVSERLEARLAPCARDQSAPDRGGGCGARPAARLRRRPWRRRAAGRHVAAADGVADGALRRRCAPGARRAAQAGPLTPSRAEPPALDACARSKQVTRDAYPGVAHDHRTLSPERDLPRPDQGRASSHAVPPAFQGASCLVSDSSVSRSATPARPRSSPISISI